MGLNDIFDDFGYPPENCGYMRSWLWNVVQRLVNANPIKCAEDTADPSSTDLDDLWGTCDVPEGAFVVWYNSVSTDTTYWVYLSSDWSEITFT